ncbi:hypothetical protein AgCh_034699 [Apium graveolens]
MTTLFLTKFQASVRYASFVITLSNVKQRENESLTSYFKRFNAESTSDDIEALIKEGYLGEWVVKDVRIHKDGDDRVKEEGGRTPRGSNNETLEENKFVRDGSIRAIYGGDPRMECNNKALARYTREARFRPLTDIHRVETRPPKVFKGKSIDISFREADARWVHYPYNDELNTIKKTGLPYRDMSGEDSWVYGVTPSISGRELTHKNHYLLWKPEALNTVGTTRYALTSSAPKPGHLLA